VSWRESFLTWSRVALLSFGGPAGQIAVMHRIIVEEKKWIGERRFLHALNFCMLLPGPEAQQLATYIGWLMHGPLGGLMAGGLFILPGLISILVLSILYTCFQQAILIQGLFFGLKPAVMAIVIEAVLRIGKRVLKNSTMVAIAASSFVALFFFSVPFAVVIVVAALLGFIGSRVAPDRFLILKGHGPAGSGDAEPAVEPAYVGDSVAPTWRHALIVSAICLPLWFGPLVLIWQCLGTDSVLYQEGTFFSQAAMVTFGGAYSVLAYVAQHAVEKHGWLSSREMLDGLGMAETTPGPLIMVVQFVAFLGAYRNPGPFTPLGAGIIGSLLTTWVTFVPCFYWIFMGAPFVERLRANKSLNASLSAITAAVVGVVLNLAVWFSIHTLFRDVGEFHFGPLRLLWPRWETVDAGAAVIAVVAMVMTFWLKRSMQLSLAVCGALGLLMWLAFFLIDMS
jgi:chromate transporter